MEKKKILVKQENKGSTKKSSSKSQTAPEEFEETRSNEIRMKPQPFKSDKK